MKLILEGASPEQLAVGEAAALAFLAANGLTLEQVQEAEAELARWAEGCIGPNSRQPKNGARARAVWSKARRVAVIAARPELAEAYSPPGRLQLYPEALGGWPGSIADKDVPF